MAHQVLLMAVVILACQAMLAAGAAGNPGMGAEAAAPVAATSTAASACLAAPFEGEATDTINCFAQPPSASGSYPHGVVCQANCAGAAAAARKVTATCDDGSWVMLDGPCSTPRSGCYKLPWAGLLGIVPYSDSVISGGKLTPYGPHANGTVIIARCDTGNPPRNVSVTCKNGKWLADSLCRAPDATCFGKPFKPERMRSSSCSTATLTAGGNAYVNGTVCTGLCAIAARSLTSAFVDGAWKMLDGICQSILAACYSSPFAGDPAAERGSITITSGGKLVQQGPWARGTVATSVCEGVSPARAVASNCQRGLWTLNATCSGACVTAPSLDGMQPITCNTSGPYPNQTRCSMSCTGAAPATNVTAVCNSGKWESDMPCQPPATASCNGLPGVNIGWMGCSKPVNRQGSFKEGTTCSGLCVGSSSGNVTASGVGGSWRMDGACSAAAAPGLACANPPSLDVSVSSWRNCSTGVSPSGSYCIGSCTSGVGALVAVCGNGTYTLTGGCGSSGAPVTCPSQLLTSKPGFIWPDYCSSGSRAAGQVCLGSCKDGYQSTGDVYAVCNGNGVFDFIADCVGTKCRNPPDSGSGSISWPGCSAFNSTTDSGERCTGSCSNGYLGGIVAVCKSGVFETIGSCSSPVTCANPPTTTPGFVWLCSGVSSSVGQVCSGSCAAGYTQAGTISATCGRLGAYQVTGSCNPNSCPNPPNNDATLSWGACASPTTATASSSSCVASCVSGYAGSKVARCENGAWSIVGNACTGPITCRNPPHSLPGYDWGSCTSGTASPGATCTATCAPGYDSAGGPATANCDVAGAYQIAGGTCTGRSCTNPPNTDATLDWGACATSGTTTASSSSCVASCVSGYAGSKVARCENGAWSIVGNACTGPITCRNPPHSLPGYDWGSCSSAGTASPGATCTATCAPGYSLSGGAISASCDATGAYQIIGRTCMAQGCSNPPNNDATLNWGACATAGTTTSSSISCVASCVSGYAGSKVTRCENGAWSIVGNACTGPITCRNPPNNLPGYNWGSCSSGTATPQTSCTATCKAGFNASGAQISATCNQAGAYQVTGGSCTGQSCASPPTTVAGYDWFACSAASYASGTSCSGSCISPTYSGTSISAQCFGGQWSVLGSCASNAPTAAALSKQTAEDTPVEIDLAGLVSDPDVGDSLVLSIARLPSHGVIAERPRASGTGTTWWYTPEANYYGTDSFLYRVTDGSGATNVAQVDLTITPVNDRPTANAVAATTNEDIPVTINVLSSVFDVDTQDVLSFAIVTGRGPAHGFLTLTSTPGIWLYTPDLNYDGGDSFVYQVTDSGSGSLSATNTVTLTVNPVKDPPILNPSPPIIPVGLAFVIDLLAGVTDPDGDSFSISNTVWSAAQGTVQQLDSRKVLYKPSNPAFAGPDSFQYQVTDATGAATTGVVSLSVLAGVPGNNAPSIGTYFSTTNQGMALLIDLVGGFTDADNELLDAIILTNPDHGTLQASGSKWIYLPATGYTGNDRFLWIAKDPRGAVSGIVVAALTVRPVQVENYSCLSSASLQKNGDAAYDGCEMVLTQSSAQAGSVFRYAAINVAYGFSVSFSFKITEIAAAGCSGDGLAFLMQATGPSALGANGLYMGYQTATGSPFTNNKVVAVEVDTYRNTNVRGNNIYDDSTAPALQVTVDLIEQARCGVSPVQPAGQPAAKHVWVDYAAEVLSIYYSDTQTKPSSPCTSLPLNLAAYFPTPNVFFGFSSGTGGCYDDHRITGMQIIY